jgi:hypothetical protein
MHGEVITRRQLPHWYVPGAAHFVTYRLAHTIPAHILQHLREERDRCLRQQPPDPAARPTSCSASLDNSGSTNPTTTG